jgi:hypothetical protein
VRKSPMFSAFYFFSFSFLLFFEKKKKKKRKKIKNKGNLSSGGNSWVVGVCECCCCGGGGGIEGGGREVEVKYRDSPVPIRHLQPPAAVHFLWPSWRSPPSKVTSINYSLSLARHPFIKSLLGDFERPKGARKEKARAAFNGDDVSKHVQARAHTHTHIRPSERGLFYDAP